MGNAANERREQRIMRLRRDFSAQKVVTVMSAAKYYGYLETTILKWAKDGNIPLINTKTGHTVVPISSENAPAWLTSAK